MRKVLKINAGIACSDRANEVEPRPNEEHENAKPRRGEMCITDGGAQRNRRYNRGAESPKSIAQGNALCNELHLSPSSPERAKSFVNNRLRAERSRTSSERRDNDEAIATPYRHCESRSDVATEAKRSSTQSIPNNQRVFGQGLLRCARNDGVVWRLLRVFTQPLSSFRVFALSRLIHNS